MTAKEVERADEAGVRLVRFLWCGNDGTVRAKASGRQGLEGRLEGGIGLTVAMQGMNALDQLQPVEGMGPVGEIRLVPDLATFRVLPYAPRTGAVVTSHVGLDGEPAPVCQRSFLKWMTGRLAERGLVLRASFENEFSLAVGVDGAYVPVDSALCFSTIAMTVSQDYVDDLVGALEAQEIPLEQYYAELGHGQQEISTGHAPAVQAADEQLLVRETVRAVAGATASSRHLRRSRGPTTPATAATSTSRCGREIATASTTARDRTGFRMWRAPSSRACSHTCPDCAGWPPRASTRTRRIVPQYWAGAFTCWGYDNREAPVRVASTFRGAEEALTNAELKACDASCNPYLALGGLIAAGLDGLERGLDPPAPVDVDPATIPESERARRGIVRRGRRRRRSTPRWPSPAAAAGEPRTTPSTTTPLPFEDPPKPYP